MDSRKQQLINQSVVLGFSLAAVALCIGTAIVLTDMTFNHFVNKLKPGFDLAQKWEVSRAQEIEDATRIMRRRDFQIQEFEKMRERMQ